MKKLMIGLVGAAVFASAFAANEVVPSADTLMGKALQPFVDDGSMPGAVSILINGKNQQVACIGWADVAAKRPITLDSPFMECSQTKGFCGVTIAKLVEDGKISLDDPVSKYLPEFKTLWVKTSETNDTITLKKAKNVLTVRMCLNHTGGFPFEIPAKSMDIPGGGWSGGMPIRSVAATAASQPIMFEPGTRQSYSNTGIDIGAAVVQAVTGMKWEDYLKKEVLDPLGMKSTTFKPTDEQLSRQIEMYSMSTNGPAEWRLQCGWEQRPYNDDHVFASAGAGLWTTANDQLKFYKMLMNLGVGDNGVRILKEETVKKILANSTRPEGLGNYSLGLWAPNAKDENEDSWFGHGGAWGTDASVNWHKKQLQIWIWQIGGGKVKPAIYEARDKAKDAFFKMQMDNEDAKAYTGRTK